MAGGGVLARRWVRQGVLSLRNSEVEIGSNNPALRNIPAFAVKTLDRTYQFCADGTPNYRLWCVLAQASGCSSAAPPSHATPARWWRRVNNISACIRAAAAAALANLSSADMKRPYAGLLKKADPKGKNWKTRWIVLDPIAKTVKYYTDASKKKMKGEFSLSGASYVALHAALHMWAAVLVTWGVTGLLCDAPCLSVSVGAQGVKTPTMYCMLVKTADRTWYLCAKVRLRSLPTPADLRHAATQRSPV